MILLLVFTSFSSFGQKWNTEEFISKYNYKEVIGNIEDNDEQKKPDRYAMYPNGKEGIHNFIMNTTKIPKKAVKDKIR